MSAPDDIPGSRDEPRFAPQSLADSETEKAALEADTRVRSKISRLKLDRNVDEGYGRGEKI